MISFRKIISSYRAKEARDFSCVLCPLPWDIAEEIRQWGKKNIPKEDLAGDGLESQIHVTLKYGIHNHDPFELRNIIWNFGPIKMKLGKTSLFSNEFDVVKIEVTSPGLHELHKLITDNFECTDTFKEYIPHVTSAYVRLGAGKKYSGRDDFEGRKMTLTAAIFSGNDYRETSLPFGP
jgi:2'-5' RNA ligase